MAKRYDVCSPRARKDSDKPYWHRVGTAFDGEKGMNIIFDSLPLPDKDGRCSVFLFEAKAKNAPAVVGTSGGGGGADFDDQIPFGPEVRG